MLGICISVCAVMGMVLSGFVLAVDEYDRTVVTYDYVTDVSGLFDYSDQPTFIDFNPSENWTGYYTTTPGVFDGVEYTTTTDNRANNYPINLPPDETAATVSLSSSWTQMTPPYEGGSEPRTWGIVYAPTGNIYNMTASDDPESDYTMNPNVTSLSTVISHITPGDSDRIRIDLSSSTVVLSRQSDWTYQRLYFGVAPISTHDTYTLNYTYTLSYVVVDLESSTVRAYSTEGTEVWAAQTEDVAVAYGGDSDNGQADVLPTSMAITLIEDPPTEYMDISAGVAVAGTASWGNGYHNGRVDILFRVPETGRSYGHEIMIPMADIEGTPNGTTLVVTISIISSGNVTITLTADSDQSSISLGDWRNFIISLDAEHGRYSVVPVSDFVSFTTYQLQGGGQTFDLDIEPRQTINTMTFEASGSTALMQGVIDTSTFLGTYDAVMIDPSLDVSDYFTDVGDLRLNLYSFALYGDSITINGVEYEVNDAAQVSMPISVDGQEPVERLVTLTNLYITFEGANTTVTFVDDGLTADLGPTTTTEIEMDGIWYFTTGLYRGVESLETVYEWDFSDFIFDGNMAIMAFLGILCVGTIVGSRVVRGGMSVLDYLVVGFAALCAITLVVV